MHDIARRRFLRFLAASPLLAAPGLASSLFAQDELIASPDLALDVFDFEAVARHRLPPAHFGYMATGVEDDLTLKANRSGFSRFYLRPRRLVVASLILTTRFRRPLAVWVGVVGAFSLHVTLAWRRAHPVPPTPSSAATE